MRLFLRAAHAALFIFATLALASAPSLAAEAEREALVITTDSGVHEFMVEIADDDRETARGLMFRRSMPEDEGMLFDFKRERPARFWMRNTYIPLDMLFIKADGTIESIAEETTPLSEEGVPSKGPVRYVLEINGGLSEKLGIDAGDTVSGPAIETRSE
jgi:uncharacterized membrane protein (UPF0127 family)